MDGDNQKIYNLAGNYVKRFDEMYEKRQGLLFWGTVGTGKSYTAACIANELLDQMIPVVMTSFVKILQNIQKQDEAEYIAMLNSAKLLILDDLGTERNTDYRRPGSREKYRLCVREGVQHHRQQVFIRKAADPHYEYDIEGYAGVRGHPIQTYL